MAKPAKKLSRPQLVNAEDPRLIAFAVDGFSNLSSLLGLAARLPTTKYDPQRLGSVMEIDDEQKSNLLEDIHNAQVGLTQTVKLIGLLMAAQDTSTGYLSAEQAVDLGFSINGLADMLEGLLRVEEELADAVPVGGSHG
jgi:hypothetical protein